MQLDIFTLKLEKKIKNINYHALFMGSPNTNSINIYN